MAPERLGKYVLLDRIAVGGMAEVHRAMVTGEHGFEKLIVIKRMLPQIATSDELVTTFIDEARLAALVQHENIVHVFDFGELDGTYFIAMEYLFGKDLQSILFNSAAAFGKISLADKLYIAARVCSGLHYAHQLTDLYQKPLNIIHRDISPQNIFVTYHGNVKVIDFGIAKTSIQSLRTKTGQVKGKIAYMSPEQADGGVLDFRSDIFAAGILLYEMVTGKRMYEGNDTLAVIQKVITVDYVAPEMVDPDLPPQAVDIIRRALAREPSERYADAGEMFAAIEECMYSLTLRGNSQSLADSLREVFAREYAAETEHLRKIIEMGRKTDGGPEVIRGGTDAAVAGIRDVTGKNRVDQTFSGTVSIPRMGKKTADSATSSPPAGEPATLKPILPTAWTTPRFGIAAGCLVAVTLLTMWVISSRPPAHSPDPANYSIPLPLPQIPDTEVLPPENQGAVEHETVIKDLRDAKIRELLEKAEERMKAYRLTIPEADAAHDYFQKVLRIDADNEAAKQGIQRIGDAYGRLADKALEKFKYKKARVYVARGLAVVPDHPRLLALKKTLGRNRPTLLFESVRKKIRNIFRRKPKH